jgi:hypothetical protein
MEGGGEEARTREARSSYPSARGSHRDKVEESSGQKKGLGEGYQSGRGEIGTNPLFAEESGICSMRKSQGHLLYSVQVDRLSIPKRDGEESPETGHGRRQRSTGE